MLNMIPLCLTQLIHVGFLVNAQCLCVEYFASMYNTVHTCT